jgi:Leucine-rich repeat (LRR) protein
MIFFKYFYKLRIAAMKTKLFYQKKFTFPVIVFVTLFLNISLSSQPLDSASLNKQKLYMGLEGVFSEPEKVIKLCLGGENLTTLPDVFDIAKNLQEINFSQNYIKVIPQSLKECKLITEIKISTNEIEDIPLFFKDFKYLKTLELASNPKINWEKALKVISKMKSLEYLDLSYNNLKDLNKEIYSLKSLKELNLTGNPLDNATIKKLKKSLPQTKIYSDYKVE